MVEPVVKKRNLPQVYFPKKRARRWRVVKKVILLCLFLYFFLVSISLMGSAFKCFGKDLAQQLIATTSNPFVGLFIGILTTGIIQSSSTTTSILVGLVGAGAISVPNAIPIVMGANIGTTITNTIVSIGHISQSAEFRRAFACAIVHDIFNILAVIILFPLQLATNFLGYSSTWLGNQFQAVGGLKFVSPVKVMVEPAVRVIASITGNSGTLQLILALVILFLALRHLVWTLRSVFLGRLEAFFDKYIFKTALRGLVFGLLLTMLVQSSSVTTSLVVPLAGAGFVTLEQVFPYTLGANVGTTITAILASLATGNIAAVTVAFAHLLFNIFAIVIIYPNKWLPLFLARELANLSVKNKLLPLGYIVLIFFIIPITLIYLVR